MKARIACLTIAFLSMLISGCTVIGIVAGASVDHRNARDRRVSWDGTKSVPRGRKVEVTLTSGDTLRGKFTGLRALPPDSYRFAYDSTRVLLAGDSMLPRLGETVFFTPVKGPRIRGLFRGFEAEALAVYQPDEHSTAYLPLSKAAQLRNLDGQSFDVELLRTLASARSLPSRSEFVVQSGAQTSRIPLQYIHEVHTLPRRTHKWILYGVIGLAADAAVAAAVISSISFDMNFGPSGGGGY
jgi:hypothetical protein